MTTYFSYQKTHDGQFEVIMQHYKGGRKAYLPRRMCLCTHEDDAANIAAAMDIHERDFPLPSLPEYWERK